MTATPPTPPADGRQRWLERFQREVLARGEVLAGDGYLFRPGEVLVHRDDYPSVVARLDWYGAGIDPDRTRRLAARGIPVQVVRLPAEHARLVPDVVRELRAEDTTRRLRVTAHHVLVGAPGYAPGGAGVPEPAAATTEPAAPEADVPIVAVVDTGLPTKLSDWHAGLAAAAVRGDDSTDALDADGDGLLDIDAGHGTFVAAVLRAAAPWLRFAVHRVLTPSGVGDEIEVADGLLAATTPIVNLSLGTYTDDDRPPLVLGEAIARVGDERVVVAAAGNEGTDRPYWPAAFDRVVAVGALDAARTRAAFSNHGGWVDACALGVDVRAAYVEGDYGTSLPTAVRFAGWARWSGTSFAAPQVAAAIAERMRERGGTARAAWESLRAEPGRHVVAGMGVAFSPAATLTGGAPAVT